MSHLWSVKVYRLPHREAFCGMLLIRRIGDAGRGGLGPDGGRICKRLTARWLCITVVHVDQDVLLLPRQALSAAGTYVDPCIAVGTLGSCGVATKQYAVVITHSCHAQCKRTRACAHTPTRSSWLLVALGWRHRSRMTCRVCGARSRWRADTMRTDCLLAPRVRLLSRDFIRLARLKVVMPEWPASRSLPAAKGMEWTIGYGGHTAACSRLHNTNTPLRALHL